MTHTRSALALSSLTTLLAVQLACGGGEPAPAPAPEAEAPEPAPEPDTPGIGPGELPAPVVEAFETVFPNDRRLRCAAPSTAVGEGRLVALVSNQKVPGPVPAITIVDGQIATVVSTTDGHALIVRDDEIVASMSWVSAEGGAWSRCAATEPRAIEITGLVLDPEGNGIAGAKVAGCEPGVVVQTDEDGRFTARAYANHACELVAVVEDEEGLGMGESVVLTEGADALIEIEVPALRIPEQAMASEVLRTVARKKNVIIAGAQRTRQRVDGDVAEQQLAGEVGAVAGGWLQGLRAWEQARFDGLTEAQKLPPKEALTTVWLEF